MEDHVRVVVGPYEARLCPACRTWIYTAAGPFAEEDPTKTLADLNHWEDAGHQRPEGMTFGRPYFHWNTKPVEVDVPISVARKMAKGWG
jgi:hypothetical protein